MKTISGDLLDPLNRFQAIGHGVNLRGVMGAGIAKQIAKKWPQVLKPYQEACANGILTLGFAQVVELTPTSTVFNLVTQQNPGPCASRWAVFTAVNAAMSMCEYRGITNLALPQVGCGLGGLNWEDVRHDLEVAERAHSTCSLTIVTYVPTGRKRGLTLEVTDEHIELLKHLNIQWEGGIEYGGPAVDPKRPFGNGDIARDIYKILHWDPPSDCESVDDLFQHDPKSRAIYEEMEHVLQLSCFNPGDDIRGVWERQETYLPFKRVQGSAE